jgi:hypothetical protein
MYRSGFRPAELAAAAATIAASLCVPVNAFAIPNDGGIAMGGSPGLLHGHPSVTMEAEKIKLTVMDDSVKVDCDFTFTNHGPACTVRMGFPDRGIGAMDPDEERSAEDIGRTPAQTTFNSFASWINGKAVASKLIRANKPGQYWHAKMVSFKANETLHVRDLYTQDIGGGLAEIGGVPGDVNEAAYVLHTGASWHGPIGKSEVIVSFKNGRVRQPIAAISLKTAAMNHADPNGCMVAKLPEGAIVWAGPCVPLVDKNTLRFVRTNWTPTAKDDIQIFFGYHPAKQQP